MAIIAKIDEIPMEGAHLLGDTKEDIFMLAEDDAKPLGPLHYDLRAYVFDDVLRVEGSLHASFQLECTRCLESFPFQFDLENYNAEEEIENRSSIDLTERIREDILLSLPAYPHCDASSDERECSVGDRFTATVEEDVEDDDSMDEGEPSSSDAPDVWSALDSWKSDKDQK